VVGDAEVVEAHVPLVLQLGLVVEGRGVGAQVGPQPVLAVVGAGQVADPQLLEDPHRLVAVLVQLADVLGRLPFVHRLICGASSSSPTHCTTSGCQAAMNFVRALTARGWW
jgi:hypothetical protein